MKSLKYIFLIFITSNVIAQLQNNNWIFGYGARVNFSGANPVSGIASISSNEATASVSDPITGQLLFYTDSRNVWNANNQVMPNGSGLLGGFFTSATQGALIVPFPNNNQKYYLFTLDEIEVQPNNPVVDDGLRYSVVDMSLNGGLGDVEVAGMNTQLATDLTEKLIVIRSTQIQGFWVIAHKRNVNQFLAWRIDACGITAQPIVSTVGSLFSSIPSIGTNEGYTGAMAASPSGDRIGMPVDYSNRIEFFDFDKTTGIVSNPLTVTVTDNATQPFLRKYGACFSPDGSKFYYSNINSVYQLDLTNYNVPAITSSFTLIASPMFEPIAYPCFQIEQAPNNKLYLAIGNTPRLDEISNPNASGLACGYVSNSVNLGPGACQLSLPAQVPLGGFAACNSNPCPFALNTTVIQPTCGNNNGCISFAPSPNDTYFYLWPFPTILIIDSVCGLAPGSYQISITNSNGCTVDTTIILTNIPSTLNVSTSNIIPVTCTGQSNGSFSVLSSGGASPYDYIITGSGGMNFGTFNNVSTNQSVTNLPAGSYTILVTDNNNCTGSANLVISTQSIAPSTPIVTTTNATCSIAGTATISNYNASFSYIFSPAGPSVGTGGIVSGMNLGTSYIVSVTNGTCTSVASNSFSVSPQQNPPIASATAAGPFCVGGAINLNASGGASYSWSGPNGFSSNSQNPQIFPANINQSGTYSVTVTDANGCVNSASVNIQVASTPTVSVTTSNSSFTFNTSDNIILTANGANNFVWTPGNIAGSSININSPSEGLLTYCAIGTNAQGCQDSACINLLVIKLDCGELYIPNAFSPNGDNANDEFCVYGSKCIETMQIKIFDRWGNMVFESSDPDFCWDGMYKGKLLNNGVFGYLLFATLKGGEKKDMKGNVSLIK
jgi:gliding motility-associated-like protein